MLINSCSRNLVRQSQMIADGEEIIKKIELYQKRTNKLPEDLYDLGLEEKEGYNAIYYLKRDRINYTVSFPISNECHMFYYSDTKTWEQGYRKMMNEK